jgi:hypothetical protein
MIDLRVELEAESQRVAPVPDLSGVFERVRRRRLRRRAGAAGLVVVLLVAGLTVGLSARGRQDVRPATSPLLSFAALVVEGAAPVGPEASGSGGDATVDRRDGAARAGAWSIVIRAADGSLGYHSAIVTYPVPAVSGGEHITVGTGVATIAGSTLTWRADAGGFARLRGDLSRPQLVAIAAAVTVVAGRPVLGALDGFTVQAAAPYRAPDVREVLLHGVSVRLAFVYTGVLEGGFFEDQLLAQPDRTSVTVHGHRAVVSTIQGGNATIAWEPRPGVVAYVGYSGPGMTDAVLAELARVANRTSAIDAAAWGATDPQIVDEHNGPSDM